MSNVVITVTEPGNPPVDITADCVFQQCNFTQNMNAVPGTFSILVRDPERTLSFDTGWEIALEIDGIVMFGGYILAVGMTNLAPAADTSDLDDYQLRAWRLTGADYNIIFDKRVWRDTANYLNSIPLTSEQDGPQLIEALENYADVSDFSTAGITSTADTFAPYVLQQGDKLRKFFETMSYFGGTSWYVNGSKEFVYVPFEDVEKRWGFSDVPNKAAITTSPDEYQGATYPFRQVEATEDGSFMVNDALIWGGSEFAGSGGTVFAREQDATSISEHGRWQTAETHFGETGFRQQEGVDARANVIINGPPGADVYGQQKGLKNPQFQFQFTWFSVDVPELSGQPDHIIPGDIVTIEMDVFGLTKLLPLRSLRTTFPDAFDITNNRVVQFDGTFGLQLSDPFTLWRYLIENTGRVASTPITAVDAGSTTTVYGAEFSDEPSPSPDGAETVFTIPFGYIAGTTTVYYNGVLQRRDTDYTESDPEAGEITMTFTPANGSNLWVLCNTLDS